MVPEVKELERTAMTMFFTQKVKNGKIVIFTQRVKNSLNTFRSLAVFEKGSGVDRAEKLNHLKSMSEYQVTCINKLQRASQHEHITHIGNSSKEWCLTREVAVQRIEAKTEAFYTVDRTTGKKAYIGVVREAGKAPYLRTYADGKWNDNLLAQPECVHCKVLA